MNNKKANPAKLHKLIAIMFLVLLEFSSSNAAVIKIEGLKFMMNGVPVTLQFPNEGQDNGNKNTTKPNEIVANVTVDAIELNETKLAEEIIESKNPKVIPKVEVTNENTNTKRHASLENMDTDKALRSGNEPLSVYVPISEDIANPQYPHDTKRKHFRDGLDLIDRRGNDLSVDMK